MNTAVAEQETVAELTKKIESLEEEIEDKDNKIEELEEGFDGVTKMEKALTLFADPANWQGANFKPVMFSDRTDSPFEIADKALN